MYKLPRIKLIGLKIITCVIVFFSMISTLVAGFFIVYTRTYVSGLSMAPTLNSRYEQTGTPDVVYINRFNKGDIGDIVVLDLRNHINFNNYTIKRLIATEGDIVNMTFDGNSYNLIVNDKVVDSRPNKSMGYNTYGNFNQYVNMHKDDLSRISKGSNGEPNGIIIKSDEIFVLGDNWDVSKDSSLVGPLSKNVIVGRVDIIVNPSQNELLTVLKRIF